MLVEKKLNFTEEQRGYVENIVKKRPMSRVACIRYLMKLTMAPVADEDDAYELQELGKQTAETLCRMTDADYAKFIHNWINSQEGKNE